MTVPQETLRGWARQQMRDISQYPAPTIAEEERIKVLEREVRELRKSNEILRLASAFFAQAELDRRFKPGGHSTINVVLRVSNRSAG